MNEETVNEKHVREEHGPNDEDIEGAVRIEEEENKNEEIEITLLFNHDIQLDVCYFKV